MYKKSTDYLVNAFKEGVHSDILDKLSDNPTVAALGGITTVALVALALMY
jgi:hypothetical protein